MAAPPSSPRVRALAGAIKKAREDREIGQRELARRLGHRSHANLSYWENGERVPSVEDVNPILDELGVVGAERDRIIDLAKSAKLVSNWLAPGFPGMSPALAGVLDCEVTATAILEWSVSVIPGLLQTEAYARAILDGATDVENTLVRMRLARQDILTRDHPVEFTALIHECALRDVLGTPRVHAEQLQHLLEVGRRGNVTVQVVRTGVGWHPGLAGAFILYDFPDTPSIVHIEHYSSSAFLYEERDVAAFKAAARKVRGVAMSPDESSGLIAEVIGDMEMR
jgi:transcriptional regulator with XRE-family HTH domain